MVFHKGEKHLWKSNKTTTDEKPKLLKPIHAAKLVDKNARTIAKMMQLLDATQRATSSAIDNETHTAQRLEKLTNRLNRRLTTLAQWADNSVIDRETPDMRATYGRHLPGNYSIKSSYGGYVPMSAPPPQPLISAQQQYRMVTAPGIVQSSSSQVAAGIQQQSNVAKTEGEEDGDDDNDDEDDEGEGGMEGKEGGPSGENMEGDDDDDDDDGDDDGDGNDDEEGEEGQESQDMNGGPPIQTALADNNQEDTADGDDDDNDDNDDNEYIEAKGEGEDGNETQMMDVVPNPSSEDVEGD